MIDKKQIPCNLCGSTDFTFLFHAVDRLHGYEGTFTYVKCRKCGLVYMNMVHRHADLSLYIGAKDEYIDETGYADDACRILLEYGFKELGLNKVWTEIYSFDDKKKKLYEKIGFHLDGTLRQNYFHNGKWYDSMIYSLLSAEYEI